MSSEELIDHERRIAELERKVSALYRRIAQAEPLSGEPGGFTFASDGDGSGAAENDPRIAELVGSGNKIGAIKLYRELTGTGLAEAKDAIEKLG